MRHRLYGALIAAGLVAAASPAFAQAELSNEQRSEAYRSIIRERTPEPHRPPGFNIIIGSQLPSSVLPYDFPDDVKDPAIRRYRYIAVNNMVVLIDKSTGRIVEVLR